MKIDVKKKNLLSALKAIKSVSDAVGLDKDTSQPCQITVENTKFIVVSNGYAQAKVLDCKITGEGSASFDYEPLAHALSVSGDRFLLKVTFKDDQATAAKFKCGRSKGTIPISSVDVDNSLLSQSPKCSAQVDDFGKMLSAIALKSLNDGVSDRTIHVNSKDGKIRGEATDGVRGSMYVTTCSKTEKGDDISCSLSITQQVSDRLASLIDSAVIGQDDNFLSVIGSGFKVVVPLSSIPPLEVLSQFTEWAENAQCYKSIIVKTKDIKTALSDLMSMGGSKADIVCDLFLSPGTGLASFAALASTGDVETTFDVVSDTLTNKVQLSFVAPYLREVLNYYSGDEIELTAYNEAVAIDSLSDGDGHSQRTVVPLVDDASIDGGKSDEEE